LLRFPCEKSRGSFENHWPFLFNAIIDSLDLREVSMIGRQFTWPNNFLEPTYEKLDRVLMHKAIRTRRAKPSQMGRAGPDGAKLELMDPIRIK
jgi:hypothetical protein